MAWIDPRIRLVLPSSEYKPDMINITKGVAAAGNSSTSSQNDAADDYYVNQARKKGYLPLNPSMAKELWIPDVFIDQAVELREPALHVPPVSLRVYK